MRGFEWVIILTVLTVVVLTVAVIAAIVFVVIWAVRRRGSGPDRTEPAQPPRDRDLDTPT